MLNHPKSRTSVSSIISNGDVATNRKHVGYAQQEGFLAGSDGKESACNKGDLVLIPGSRRSPGERNGNPLQYSCLENGQRTEEPGGLQSMGSQRVGHDLMTNTHMHTDAQWDLMLLLT